MAQQQYTVEQLNYGRKVIDFMRWDNLAFAISGLLLIVSIAIIGVRGFNWGLDFTGGTVIEISLDQPANLDDMRASMEKAGFTDPVVKTLVAAATLLSVCRQRQALRVRNWVTKSSDLSTPTSTKMRQ